MIDSTSLFLHVLAATAMVAGGATQVLAGRRVRTATTGAQLSSWAGFARQAGLLVLVGAVVSFLTGGHLAGAVWTTDQRSGFDHPFITIGVAALVLLAPIGPMLGGPALQRLAVLGDEQPGPLDPDLLSVAGAARIWAPVHSLLGVSIGIIALMTYKPQSWAIAALLPLLGFGLGWLAGRRVSTS